MESAVLLRVPAPLAEQLHKQLAGHAHGHSHGKDKDKERGDEKDGIAVSTSSSSSSGPSLKLSFLGPDGGVVLQQSHSAPLSGQLVNLPTIIECHKTFDNIHYYKCADIAQMIVVQNATQTAAAAGTTAAASAHAPSSLNANPARPKNANDPAAASAAAASAPPIPVDYPHGLTPPTRDIRPKRFDRDTKVPPRIVTEVDALMANIKDNKAVNYFELVEDEEEVGEEEEDEEEEMADEEAEEDEEDRRQQQQQQQDDDERRRVRTDEPARSSAQQTSFQQAQKLLSTPAVHRGTTPDTRAIGGTPFLAVSASPLRPSPISSSVFGASPAVHADTTDMTDVSLDLFSQSAAPSSSPAAAAAAAGSSSVGALQPVSSPLLSINVSGVENMFGASPQQSQQQAGTQPMDLASFLPETPHTPVQGAAAAFPSAAAAAAAAAPPSAADLVRAELSDVQSRISVAEKEIADSKNMLLRRKAEQRLQALQDEKRAIEAKL